MTDVLRPKRHILEGVVVSDKMDKTRVVVINWSKRDPRFEKTLYWRTKVYAHDEKNETHNGDRVRLMATRPLSKTKRWRVTEKLK